MAHANNCVAKIRYESKSEAQEKARDHNKLYRKLKRPGNHVTAYRCHMCDGYHLGRNRSFKKGGCR